MAEDPHRRVLVVEDEAMVAMMIEDLLTELGFTVAGVAVTAGEAMDMVRSREVDFALLDINLGEGETSFDVAAALGERNTPFAWLTGYGARGVPPGFGEAPVLDKPIDPDLFAEVLRKLKPNGNGRSRPG